MQTLKPSARCYMARSILGQPVGSVSWSMPFSSVEGFFVQPKTNLVDFNLLVVTNVS